MSTMVRGFPFAHEKLSPITEVVLGHSRLHAMQDAIPITLSSTETFSVLAPLAHSSPVMCAYTHLGPSIETLSLS